MASVTQIIRRRRRKRQYRQETAQQRETWGWLIGGGVFIILFGPILAAFGWITLVYTTAYAQLPDPRQTIYLDPLIGATRIYDSSGGTLLVSVSDPLGDQREWIPLEELPEYLIDATILWEDPDFFETVGFDLITMAERLMRHTIQSGSVPADSSITGRLVRNVILPEDRTMEIAFVAAIQAEYTPEEIIEWHLNTNYYGNEIYGIEAAAQIYLGKSARDLTLDEAALLAAIPTAPRFNPLDDETAARGRQGDLLRRMLSEGLITRSQFETSIDTQTRIQINSGQIPLIAPEFAIFARRQAEDILDSLGLDGAQLVSRGGLRIITTLDLDLYYQAECALQAHLAQLRGDVITQSFTRDNQPCFAADFLPDEPIEIGDTPPDSGIIVVIRPETGEIMAMIGNATEANRQPGVVLHPFAYLTGFLSTDYTPATMLLDIPRPFPGAQEGLLYIPNNVDGQFRGPLSLREAMNAGLQPPVTQVVNTLGINEVLDIAHRVGINSLRGSNYDLSLLEGSGEVSALDIAYAYSSFALMGQINGLRVEPIAEGFRDHDPVAIRRIEDANGNVLWEYDNAQVTLNRVPVMEPPLAYLVNHILSDRTTRQKTLGQGNVLERNYPTAVISGQTLNHVDNWTVGYTPYIVTVVNLHRQDGRGTSLTAFGTDGAAYVWRSIMDYLQARDNLPTDEWARPASIAETVVCEISGMAANGNCETRREIFLGEWQFPPVDTYWQLVEINSQNGRLATLSTPAALRTTVAYFIPPEEAMDWWRANNLPLPPTQTDNTLPNLLSSTVILQPADYDIVGGVVDIRGSMESENLDYYQVLYGEGINPTSWITLSEGQEAPAPGTSLALWDTAGLDGTYVIQLRVVRDDGTPETGVVQITVDNIPPAIILNGSGTYRFGVDDVIPLVAEVTDNIRVDRVDFYHNGQFISSDDTFPYEYNHPINRTGIEQFTAVVYDAVGNTSESTIEVEVTR
ncbi:MAG: hypothetical protein CUN56_08200 [Phototrophicales bacterium]|nr:MAG: hypothetical protein CUN56_08200 [Phototrophicales bacterium]